MLIPLSDEGKVVIKTAEKLHLLEAERKHLSALKGHPSIRQLIDNIETPNCMVLEYMETDLWSEALKRKLQRVEIKTIAKRFLEGLVWAHSKDIVHTGESRVLSDIPPRPKPDGNQI